MILEKAENEEDYDIGQTTVRESERFLCRLGYFCSNKIKNEVWYKE